jgi:hypothetical protein
MNVQVLIDERLHMTFPWSRLLPLLIGPGNVSSLKNTNVTIVILDTILGTQKLVGGYHVKVPR